MLEILQDLEFPTALLAGEVVHFGVLSGAMLRHICLVLGAETAELAVVKRYALVVVLLVLVNNHVEPVFEL